MSWGQFGLYLGVLVALIVVGLALGYQWFHHESVATGWRDHGEGE